MKKSRSILILSMLLLTAILSACVGGAATTASSWPGLMVDGDTAYLAYNTHVYAINLANGTEKWRYPQAIDRNKSFYATPVMTGDGQLLVGSFHNVLYSLDPATGQENSSGWPFTEAKDRYVAGPLSLNGDVVAPNADFNVYNITDNGRLHWKFSTGDYLWSTPVSDGQKIYLTSMDHHVYALDQANGSLVWKTDDLAGAVVGSPTLSEDGSTLYIGTFGNKVIALDASSGANQGNFATQGWVWSGPALHDGVLYFGDVEGNLYAVNAASLTQQWVVHPDTEAKMAISDRPLVLDGKLYVASESGVLYIVDPATGSVTNQVDLGGEKGELNTSPVAAGDLVLVAVTGSDNLLVALDKSGAQKWAFATPK